MMKYSTYTWNLAWKLKSASLPPARHQPPSLIPTAQTIIHEKAKQSRNEVQLPTNHIVLPWPKYAEHRAKRGKLGTQP